MTTPLTSEQAIDLLRRNPDAYRTPEQLRALAALVDANAPGRLTVLYSGPTANGVWSTDVVNAMLEAGEDVRVINLSQAANFLTSRDFYHAVAKTYGIPDVTSLSNGNYRGPAADWLYHPTQGPWADASARFADTTVGEVRMIVCDAALDRIFGSTEVPHILANSKITAIEGVPREVLVTRQASHGTPAAFEMIVARARENVGQLQVAVNYAGTPLRSESGRLMMDSRAYFVGTEIAGKTPAFTIVTRPLADSMNAPTEHVLAGQRHWEDWQRQLRSSAYGQRDGTAAKGLGAAGMAITAYDAADTFHDAARLRGQGNDTAAQARIERFAIQNATGWTGAATFAGIGAAAGVKTGPGLLVTGALGGVIGAVAGDKVSEWINDRKVNRQQDSLGNTWTFDPRHSEKGWTRERRELDMQQMSATTVDMPIYKTRTLIADAAMSDQLTWRASSTSIELALGAPPQGRDPYRLAANEQDARSAREAPWSRDPDSLQWTREVSSIVDYRHNNPVYRMRLEEASPQRGAELERESRAVIARNATQTPVAMAAQFQAVYEKNGWSRHGALPDSVTYALRHPGRIVGSDGRLYERNSQGRWTHDGLLWDSHAQANLKAELEATYQQQRANADIPTLEPLRVTAPRQLQEDNNQQQPAPPSPQAQAPTLRPHDFRDPAHPQHARYAQTLAAVHAMEAEHGIAPGSNSEKVAAAFVDRMQQTGFQELARMELRGNGPDTELVALPRQFGPWDEKKPALVLSADQAVARSVEQATAAWAARALPPLEATPSPPQVSLAASAHPAAAGLGELRGQIASAYAAAGIARSGEQLEQATAAVALDLRQGHRSQADAVFLQPDRTGAYGPHCALIAVHGDKDDVFRHRSVTPAQDLQRPSEDSYLQLAQLSQQQAREQALAHQHAQQQGQSASMGV